MKRQPGGIRSEVAPREFTSARLKSRHPMFGLSGFTASVRGASVTPSPLRAEWPTRRTSSQFCGVAGDHRDFPEAVYANEKA